MKLITLVRKSFKGTRFQNWRITSFFYRLYTKLAIRRYERPTVGTTLIGFKGIKFEIESKDITMLPTLISGDYEDLEFEAISRLINLGEAFLDIGSNIGIWSLFVSRLVGPTGEVIAVEPNPKTLALLERNLNRNPELGRVVTVVPFAISNFNGISNLESADYLGTSHLVSNSKMKDFSSTKADLVHVTTLDHLIIDYEINPTFIKCDVEGFEAYVIEGGENYLRARKPKILFEISGIQSARENVNWDNAIRILASTYSCIEVFGPTSHTHTSKRISDILQNILSDGRLHNVLLISI